MIVDDPPPEAGPGLRAAAAWIAVRYGVLALGWILLSDLVVAALSPDLADVPAVNISKGAAFVVVTAACLYAWTRREMLRRERTGERLRRFVEDAPDLIYRYRIGPGARFEFVSPASRAILGYAPSEFLANPELARCIIHEEERARTGSLVADPAALDGTTEVRCRHRDGREVWLEQRTRLVTDEAGRQWIEGIARDITARKREEAEARLLATAVEASGDAVFVCDPRGVIQYVNPAFTRISGYAFEEAVGSTPRILKSGHQPAEFYEQLWKTVLSGRVFSGEFVNRRKDGSLYTHQATITPVLDAHGGIRNIVAAARDVTVERRLESELRRTQVQELVGRMASGTAHDFKNLLAVVQLSAEQARAALEDGRPSEAMTALGEVAAAAERGAGVVRRLLAVGRGRDALEVAPGDLGTALEALRPTLRTLVPPTAGLEVVVEAGLPPVLMDVGALEQIVVNLVTNAAHAVGEHGRVRVSVAREPAGAGVVLSVCDDGAGIPADLLEHVFEPFFTTRPDEGGSGLGLTMVRALVEQQGATLHVSSGEGSGTEMAIVFAAAAQPAGDEAAPAAAATTVAEGYGERLLLVDDEPAIRALLERQLSRLGYDVVAAADGLEAQALLNDGESFDLVVTDVHMPKASGIDIYRRARELGLASRFLFMSGDASADLGTGEFVGDHAHFIEKPYTLQQMSSKVREALEPV